MIDIAVARLTSGFFLERKRVFGRVCKVKRWLQVGLLFMLLSTGVYACNIPVFRYALERWRSDALQLLIFHAGRPTGDELAKIEAIRDMTTAGNGQANLELRLVDLNQPMADADQQVWQSLTTRAVQGEVDASMLPTRAVLLGSHLRGPYQAWQGTLEQAHSHLLNSPARQQIAERLLSGHSIVWLLIRAKSDAKSSKPGIQTDASADANEAVKELLRVQIEQLAKSLELPEGIGLPGSELYSDVPLFLKFSIVEIERDDPQEAYLLQLAEGFQADAFAANEPLVLPVFGRGRALEVIPADQLSGPLIRDLTQFLSAACSCQVKEQNPGLDLLMSVAWQQQLFGDDGPLPPPASENGLGQQRSPVLLTIPPGRK
ncbi:MAG: hypothetical protein NXI32_02120 [bacterium]|nr:hypothetical protein [bacterium]